MALDASAVRAITEELKSHILGGRIDKIHQPEKDEIVLHIRTYDSNYKLLMSANSANPRIYFTEHTKKNPITAPMFCMLLRKHLQSGKITAVEQTGFERIIKISIESYNELGDLTQKHLITEIMGRHSNIILTDNEGKIIDSVKHVDFTVSSVRQILPGFVYEYPPTQDKTPLLSVSPETRIDFSNPGMSADRAVLTAVSGISPLSAREIVYRALHDTSLPAQSLNTNKQAAVKTELIRLSREIGENKFSPCLIIDASSGKIRDFSSFDIQQYGSAAEIKHFDSMSAMLDSYFYGRDMQERMKRKSADLVKLLSNNTERLAKKISILTKTVQDAKNKDKHKLYGDLITANIYMIKEGDRYVDAVNYFDPEMSIVSIPLDAQLTPSENAQRYYKKYNKAKTAEKEAAAQLEIARAESEYLESTLTAVENSEDETDLSAIRSELTEQGYIQDRSKKKQRKKEVSKPLHFVSPDGFDIYVGKNNTQNDYLSLKFANTSDWWFHTKNIHGSHVIIKLGLDKEVPHATIVFAAQLAAYYSKARSSSQVPVDYTQIKNVKKPRGAKPGMVIYDGYNTIYVSPSNKETADLN